MERSQAFCNMDKAALTEAAVGTAHNPARAKRQKWHREWERRNMRSVTTRVGVEYYDKLVKLCDEQNITIYQLVRELVDLYMKASIRNGALRGGDAK